MQVLWLDVLESHEAVNARGGRVRDAGGREVDGGGEFDEGVGHARCEFLLSITLRIVRLRILEYQSQSQRQD